MYFASVSGQLSSLGRLHQQSLQTAVPAQVHPPAPDPPLPVALVNDVIHLRHITDFNSTSQIKPSCFFYIFKVQYGHFHFNLLIFNVERVLVETV